MKILLFGLLFLIACGGGPRVSSVSKENQKIISNHIYGISLSKLKDKIVKDELTKFRKNLLSNKNHPLYVYHFVLNGKNHNPLKQTYMQKIMFKSDNDKSYDDGLVHFAELTNTSDEFMIMTYDTLYKAKKVGFLKTKLEIYRFGIMQLEKKEIMVQTGFPMTTPVINLDKTFKSAKRDYKGELDTIQVLEPNIFNQRYKNL